MRTFFAFICLLVLATVAKGQNNCANAARLCANNTLASSTQGANSVGSDPVLHCGDLATQTTVWFTVTAISNGFCTITVGQINNTPGLEVEAYTGVCGSLITTGFCNSANGPNSSMNITFPVTTGTTYYIMVDGSSGNKEAFSITASSSTNSIVGKPVASFIPSTTSGCVPLSVTLFNTTIINGDSNLTYQWQINGGPLLNGTGDTTIELNSTGYQIPVVLTASNSCGTGGTYIQYIDVEQLDASIIPPSSICIGTPSTFSGFAQYLPDPPFTTPNIIDWDWDFGDPASGGNNTANGDTVQHTFIGAGPNFTVRLIATSADCGSDTVYMTVTAKPKVLVNAGPDQVICQGQSVNLTATTTNATSPINYSWSGTGSFSCGTCNSTIVSSLPPGTNTINIHVDDANTCPADSSVRITVTPKPVVSLGSNPTVCKYATVPLNANMTTGTAPFTYNWIPCSGLSNCSIKNPLTTAISSPRTYCVIVKDTIGCPSDTTCININLFLTPVITAAPGTLCATDTNLVTTLTVGGAGTGSTYSWRLSPNYSLINSSNSDSSVIGIKFTSNVPASYTFRCVIKDGVTGCTDTVTSVYSVVPGLNMTITKSAKICFGNSITLTATGANTYSWFASPSYPFANPTSATQVVSPTSTTIFAVIGKIGTCLQLLRDTITVNPKPTISTSNDSIVCPNSSVNLLATATGGTPAYTYSWTPSSGLSSTTIPNPVAHVPSSATYCVTARDSNNCIADTKCVTLTVTPTLAVLSLPTSICATDTNRNVTFNVTGAGAGSTYRWYLSANYSFITAGNTDSSSVTATFPPNIPATYSFTVIVHDGVTGCIDTLTKTFTVTPGLNISVAGNNTICFGGSTSLTANGASTYSWSAPPPYSFSNPALTTQLVSPTTTTTFTLIGSNGTCNQRITYTVTVNPKPDAFTAPITPFCGCTTVNLSGNLSTPGMTYSWVSTGGHTITNPSLLNASSFICTTDSFVLFVTNPATGCSDTASVKANHLPSPAATFVVAPKFICPGTPTAINLNGTGSNTNPGTTYHWSSNNIGTLFVDTTALSTIATIFNTTIFYLTVKDASGCDSTISDTVYVYQPPAINALNPFICTSDANKTSNVVISGATPGSTFTWDTIPSCATPNTANTSSQVFDFSACAPGIYPFYITVVDGTTGCSNQIRATVTIVTGVTLVTTGNTTICEGNTVTLTAGGANSYSWSPGSATTTSITVSGLTVAGSPYQYIVQGAVGSCSTSDTMLVTVNPIPVTNPISGPTSVCVNDSNVLYTVTPATGNYLWTISNGSVLSAVGNDSVYVKWDTAGTGILIVTDTNSNGCAGMPDTIRVTINPHPITSAISGPDTVCANSTVIYTVTKHPGSSYNWILNGGKGTIIGGNNLDTLRVKWDSTGTGYLLVNEISNLGCGSDTVRDTVYIFPIPPKPVISGKTSLCEGDTMQLYTVTPDPGSIFSWAAFPRGTIVTGQGNDSIIMNWGLPGKDTLAVIDISQYGCQSSPGFLYVTITPLPVVSVSPDTVTICRNSTLPLTGTVNTGTIKWTTTGTGIFNNDSIASPVYTPGATDSGQVVLMLIASTTSCGKDTDSVIVTVIPAPIVTLTSTAVSSCGDTATLVATGGGSYVWSPGGATTDSITVYPTITTTYTVIVNNAYNCPAFKSILMTVTPPGRADGGPDLIVCRYDSVFLNGFYVNAGGLTWSTLGDGNFTDTLALATVYIPGINDSTAGSVTILLSATGGCRNLTDTITVTLFGKPSVYAGTDTTIAAGPKTGASANLNGTSIYAVSTHWTSTGTGTFSPNDSSLTGTYILSPDDFSMDSIIITLTGTSPCGTAVDYFVIHFTSFTIPNVFTPYPNSPGYNDFFEIIHLPRGAKLKIWDRWGLLVYSSDNYLNDWDAHGLTSDEFYYVLETKVKEYHGWVHVIR